MSTSVLERPAPAPAGPGVPAAEPGRPRLSELIRDGARQHPQGRSHLYNPATGATCALGALLVGLLGTEWTRRAPYRFDQEYIQALVRERTGVDLRQKVEPPERLGYAFFGRHALSSLIIRLNDGARWSREQIADYLQSIGY